MDKVSNILDLGSVRSLLLKAASDDQYYTQEERMNLYRFVDKLSDSDAFEGIVNKAFSEVKNKTKLSIDSNLQSRTPIRLNCGFELVPVGSTNWELVLNGSEFLVSLNKATARKIALDINVAFNIKHHQQVTK
jgi:hypothetical protein